MKKIAVALLLMVAISTQAQKVTSGLLFCSGVNEEFKPINASSEVSIKDGEATILFYFWNDNTLATTNLTYKTFLVDGKGKETFSASIFQPVQPGWRMVKQSARFTNTGTYRVKVYNKENLEVAAATLTVK